MNLRITGLQLSGANTTDFVSCLLCPKSGGEMLRLHVTGELFEGKPHAGIGHVHPVCLIENLPAVWAIEHVLPPVREILEPMAVAIGKGRET